MIWDFNWDFFWGWIGATVYYTILRPWLLRKRWPWSKPKPTVLQAHILPDDSKA